MALRFRSGCAGVIQEKEDGYFLPFLHAFRCSIADYKYLWSPRPYSRHQTVCGTKGFMQKYPVPCILLDEYGKEPLAGEDFEKVMERYKHPFTATIGEEAKRKEMPNEMNYIMDYRLVHCLRNGLPLDQDVYDAAEWSCITELSELSVRQGSIPVEIPDFTRGNWEGDK